MSDLRDERVREYGPRVRELRSLTIIPEGGMRPASMSYVTRIEYRQRAEALVDELAREVLDLRERVAEMAKYRAEVVASWKVSDAAMRQMQEHIATLTSQRDGLEAVARKAVDLIHPMNKSDKRDLRARLAAITETKGTDDATTA